MVVARFTEANSDIWQNIGEQVMYKPILNHAFMGHNSSYYFSGAENFANMT